jgi:hypothetical protein
MKAAAGGAAARNGGGSPPSDCSMGPGRPRSLIAHAQGVYQCSASVVTAALLLHVRHAPPHTLSSVISEQTIRVAVQGLGMTNDSGASNCIVTDEDEDEDGVPFASNQQPATSNFPYRTARHPPPPPREVSNLAYIVVTPPKAATLRAL